MMAFTQKNRRAPVTDDLPTSEYLQWLADKYTNGIHVPDFPAAPSTKEYRVYFDTTLGKMGYWNGAAWVYW